MKNKEIQEERMRGYFIDATKELLKGEGLKSISVRNIADRAGYSYATLYNYFKDIKDLVFECVKDFQDECTDYIQSETAQSSRGIAKIEAITETYLKYFVQYPGIFELFFLECLFDLSEKQTTVEMINSFLDRLCSNEWNYCIQENLITIEESETKKSALQITTAGLLLFYLNRRHPDSYMEFLTLARKQVRRILM
ncbi:TetR/AcrR family transcriptional regulator [bacterium]|nr:TetR/AcrR family transcriptional regulator [bacterium]MBU1064370.1 TetR/AcrR family transcriptional regulator [bacterium]MBU1634441.1 TetR/AcrR family transcriptional regulator [bacterium]MBU1874599.1 TetR/AcrR family transcriptional regulator [bacterium]